jgi:hypothetical protein
MKEINQKIDKLRADAEDWALIGINDEREQSFRALAERLRELAAELENLAAYKLCTDPYRHH